MAEFREARKGMGGGVLRINTQLGFRARRQLRLPRGPEFFLKTGFQHADYLQLRDPGGSGFLF